MRSKFLTLACLTITLVLTSEFSLAQEKNAQEIYNLCSKFPLNSRCEGIDKPIALKARNGEEVVCNFTFDPGIFKQPQRYSVLDDIVGLKSYGIMQPGGCKLVVSEDNLIVYQEQGNKVAILNDKRSTSETKINSDSVFISNYQIWNEVHRWEIGFIAENSSQKNNQTNFLVIFMDKETAELFAKEINLLSSYDRETLSKTANHYRDVKPNIKRLLSTNECKNCDLSNADLEEANLQSANLEGANLQNANLQRANLQGANLKKTFMLQTNLAQANLAEAEFKGANLTLANLNKSILTNANLQGVNLQQANLQQADLESSDLSAPSLLQEANFKNANLRQANLKGANFKNANLRQANLKGADLGKTDIKLNDIPNNYSLDERALDLVIGLPVFSFISGGTDFSTSFLGADLEGANFSSTDLDKASFENANLTNTDFSNSNLEEENLEKAILCGVIMADGSRSDRNCKEK
jgi:uncharacterized protein YjbI with pentapeptide repeats